MMGALVTCAEDEVGGVEREGCADVRLALNLPLGWAG